MEKNNTMITAKDQTKLGTLPNFIIVGERRCGSTSLTKWMEAHPEIYMHPKVDLNYFIDDYVKYMRKDWEPGEIDYDKWWENHSAEGYAEEFLPGKDLPCRGEKSADLLFWRPAHERMAKIIAPDTKLVITLRNPIDRAWSMFWNEVGKKREDLSFEEAVAQEEQRISGSAYARDHMSYVTRGFYDESIKDFFQHFDPAQTQIIFLEETVKNPKKALSKLYEFIGVDHNKGLERAETRYNNNWTSVPYPFWTRNKFLASVEEGFTKGLRLAMTILIRDGYQKRRIVPKIEGMYRQIQRDIEMSVETRKLLQQTYLPHIEALEEYLKKDLSFWKK